MNVIPAEVFLLGLGQRHQLDFTPQGMIATDASAGPRNETYVIDLEGDGALDLLSSSGGKLRGMRVS